MSVDRLRMRRATAGLTSHGEFGPFSNAVDLAPMMLAAYRGTPDDEGETIADTVDVLSDAMAGEWGEWVEEASFVALEDGVPVGAVLTAMADALPFISFVFTPPEHQGRGVATRLIARAGEALAERGHATVDLWVNPASERAVSLYRHLGFEEI